MASDHVGSPSQGRENYAGLDIIRFAAAMAIVLYHLGYWRWLPSVPGDHADFARQLSPAAAVLRWGWVGVPVFFVLSGFVIALSAQGRTAKSFVRSRFLRLYPAAWICATISLGFIVGMGQDVTIRYLNSLALWPAGPWVSSVYWTLGVEIVFYLLVALCIRTRVKLISLGLILGFISSAYWIGRMLDFAAGGRWKHVFGLFEGQIGNLTLVPHGCYFAIGILISTAMRGRWTVSSVSSGLVFTAAGVVSLVSSGRFYVAQDGGAAWMALIPALVWLAASVAIAATVMFNSVIARRMKDHARLTRLLGLATYPLYLVHSELGIDLMLWLRNMGAYALLLAVASVMVVAWLVTRAEEALHRGAASVMRERLRSTMSSPAGAAVAAGHRSLTLSLKAS